MGNTLLIAEDNPIELEMLAREPGITESAVSKLAQKGRTLAGNL